MLLLANQECVTLNSAHLTKELSWLAQWGVDPLEPRYQGKNFIRWMFELIGAPPGIREQALECVVDDENLLNQELIHILTYPEAVPSILSEVSWETKSHILQHLLAHSNEINDEIEHILNDPVVKAIIAGELDTLESLLKSGTDLSLVDQHYSLVKLLINWIDFQDEQTSLKILKFLKKNGAMIQEKLLFQSLIAASKGFVEELFADQTIIWTEEAALECLENVKSRCEESIWQILKNAGWPCDTLKGVLAIAIEERNLKAIQWLINEGISIHESDRQAAWDCGDLDIIECFLTLQEISDRLADASIGTFENIFLFSSLEKIQQYLLLNPIIFDDIFCKIVLVGRYTRKHALLDLIRPYKIDPKEYVQNQMAFGALCHQAVLQKLKDLRSGERDLFLTIEAFAKVRFQIAFDRKDRRAHDYATFRFLVQRGIPNTSFGAISWQKLRYSFVIPWIKKVSNKSYTLKYADLPLTTIDLEQRRWLHTSDEVVSKLLPVLQKMHEELLDMKIDPQNLTEVRRFQEKLATAYWLGCNLMLTYRGNAQYFLMWLSLMMHYHGFDPLLPKRETPQPDCLAISLPLSDFVLAFSSLFENPL